MSNDFEDLKKQTVDALKNSSSEFEKLKETFVSASDCFDDGKDLDGLQIIQDAVHPGISALCHFVENVFTSFNEGFNDELKEELITKIEDAEKLIKDLSEETVSSNFTEIGDILRFDFTDIVDDFAEIFPKMIIEIQTMKEEE